MSELSDRAWAAKIRKGLEENAARFPKSADAKLMAKKARKSAKLSRSRQTAKSRTR